MPDEHAVVASLIDGRVVLSRWVDGRFQPMDADHWAKVLKAWGASEGSLIDVRFGGQICVGSYEVETAWVGTI